MQLDQPDTVPHRFQPRQPRMMRIVLLTGDGPEHHFVAHAVARAFPLELGAIIVADPPARPLWTRARSYGRRYSVPQLASRAMSRLYRHATGATRQWAERCLTDLFPDGDDGMPRPELVRRVPGHNGRACLDLLAALRPEVIAVYGTGIIREGVIEQASRGVVNLHTGISPRYRGSDSVFWALHNEEPEWVGATVHLLDAGIDSGPIIETVRPPIDAEDDEASLFCKCVVLGAGSYVAAIRALGRGGAVFPPQCLEEGREYRFVDRTVAAERRVRRLLAEGLLRRHAAGAP